MDHSTLPSHPKYPPNPDHPHPTDPINAPAQAPAPSQPAPQTLDQQRELNRQRQEMAQPSWYTPKFSWDRLPLVYPAKLAGRDLKSEFKTWSEGFRVREPLALDLLPIMARDPKKQQLIAVKYVKGRWHELPGLTGEKGGSRDDGGENGGTDDVYQDMADDEASDGSSDEASDGTNNESSGDVDGQAKDALAGQRDAVLKGQKDGAVIVVESVD